MRTLRQAFCVGCLAKRTYVSEARGCEMENRRGQTSQWVSAVIFVKYTTEKRRKVDRPFDKKNMWTDRTTKVKLKFVFQIQDYIHKAARLLSTARLRQCGTNNTSCGGVDSYHANQ